MKKYFLVLVLVFSCKKADISEPVGLNFYFENPQQIKDSELIRFPNKFQGLFMNSDSVFLNFKYNRVYFKKYNKWFI